MPADSFALLVFFFIAAACGWAASRFFSRTRAREPRANINPDYLKGLNYLLEDNPDKAIEVFVSMMAVDNETAETHFALGSLFRRRGEVDRAIRIHQNLIARPNLGREHRDQALFALAEDYLRAGLLDRAESLFEKLAGQSSKKTAALEKLTSIYEQQKDWNQAIAARRKLGGNDENDRIIAHYYCELASESFERRDETGARQFLKKAHAGGPWLVRGALMRAAMAARDGDVRTAQRLYRKVIEHDARFLTEVWVALREVFEPNSSSRGFSTLLDALVRKKPAALSQLAYAAIVHDDLELEAARTGLLEFLQTNSTLNEALSAMQVVDADLPPNRDQLERIAGGLRALLRNRAGYLCAHCGYASESLYWQCPGCRTWDSIRPNTNIPGDRLALGSGK
jgi:lipopolysaccharide biosynthesis regulator YciM